MNRRHINLLTWRFRFYLVVRERLLQWTVIWIAVLFSATAIWQLKRRRLHDATAALTLMESRCAPLKAIQSENRDMTARLSKLNSHRSLLNRLDDQQVPFRLLGLVSHRASQCDGGIRVKSMALNRVHDQPVPGIRAADAKARQLAAEPREIVILRLDGIADDNLAISRFVAALRDSGVFMNVDLRSSVGVRVDRERAQTFVVECRLSVGGAPVAHHIADRRRS